MKKYLLIFCLLLSSSKLFAQQFAQYNTGTLYDSFENPAQRSFIPDSSRMYASNFLFPTFDGNISLTGDAQQTLKSRLVNHTYMNSGLQIGGLSGGTGEGINSQQISSTGHLNYLNGNADAYLIMFKMFTNLDGNQEVGFFLESNATLRGVLTDETVGILNGSVNFPGTNYNNVFNSSYHYQYYYQFGATYREQVTKQFSIGFKGALLTGMSDVNVNIRQSHISFDKAADTALVTLGGINRKAGLSKVPLSNPGAAISIGTEYKMRDNFVFQANLKNFGFIHWDQHAEVYDFYGSHGGIDSLTAPNREKYVLNTYKALTSTRKTEESYNTLIDGSFDLSISKSFWLGDERIFRYAPSLIATKELAYSGFTGGLVNPVYYRNYSLSVITSYNDMKLFNFGLQFMIKSENAEFFIASQSISQSASFVMANLKSQNAINSTGSFSGGDIMMGFSLKFGDVIEHPMNANKIPMGDDNKGFLGRMYQKIFHPKEGTIQNN